MDDCGDERINVCVEVGVKVDVFRGWAFTFWEGLGLRMFGTCGLSLVGRDLWRVVPRNCCLCHPYP